MTNPKANKPLSLEQIRADAKSMGIPATALMDMLAGTLRGATASTLGTPADIYNLANTISGDRLGNIPYDTDYFKSKLPPTISGNDASRSHTAEFGEDFGTLAGADAIHMAKLAGKGVAKGAKLAGQEIADRVATGQKLMPGPFSEPQMAMHVVKPKGGNWLNNSVEKSLYPLTKSVLNEHGIRNLGERQGQEVVDRYMEGHKKDVALNNWVNKNLTNYVKNQMGTPEDPVRLMIDKRINEIDNQFNKDIARADRFAQRAKEETDPRIKANLQRNAETAREEAESERDLNTKHVMHIPQGQWDLFPDSDYLKRDRSKAGYPVEGMAKSEPAKAWENTADVGINIKKASDIQNANEKLEKIKQLELDRVSAEKALNEKVIQHMRDQGLDLSEQQEKNIIDTLGFKDKESMVGDDTLSKAWAKHRNAMSIHDDYNARLETENPWISKVAPDTNIYSSATLHPSSLGFDHVVDVIKEHLNNGTLKPEELKDISVEQAVRRTADYDKDKAKKMAETAIKNTEGMPVHKEYPEGYKWIELAPSKEKKTYTAENLPEGFELEKDSGGTYQVRNTNVGETPITDSFSRKPEEAIEKFNKWIEQKGRDFDLEKALKYEGDTMGHCVGGYCPDVLEGKSRIYSLRDKRGEPHVTIEVKPNQSPYPVSGEAYTMLPQETKAQYGQYVREWRQRNPDIQNLTDEHTTQALKEAGVPPQPDDIIQIKGKGNDRPISKYDPFTQDFVKSGNWGKVGDLHNTGLVDTTTTTANMEAKKLGLNIPRFMSREEKEALRDHFYAHQWEPETNPQVPEILKKYQDQTQPIKHSEDQIQEHSFQPATTDEAQKHLSNGHYVYGLHEQADAPHLIRSADEVNAYTPDQIAVVPKHIDPNPEGYAKGGRVKHKIHVSDDIDMMRHELMMQPVRRFKDGGQEGLLDKSIGAGEAALSAITNMFNPVIGGAVGLAKSIPESIKTGEAPASIASREAEKYLKEHTGYQPRTEKGQEYMDKLGKLMEDLHVPPVVGDLSFAHNVGEVTVPIKQLAKDYLKANPPSVGMSIKPIDNIEAAIKPEQRIKVKPKQVKEPEPTPHTEDQIAEHSFQPASTDEAQKHLSNGHYVYGLHEQAEEPHLLRSADEVNAYTPDQLAIVPKDIPIDDKPIELTPEQESAHKAIKEHVEANQPVEDIKEDAKSDDIKSVDGQKKIPEDVDSVSGLGNALNIAKSKIWNKGRDLKQAMQDALKAKADEHGVDLSAESPETLEYLTRMAVKDGKEALDQNPNAVGWYDLKTRQALAVMSLIHPEIASDLDARNAFTWAMAVTSNGLKVDKNFELAEKAYEQYKKTGQMPTDIGIGQAQAAINDSLGLYNKLKEKWGPENLRKFMNSQFKVGEISAIDPSLKPGGEHADVDVQGASILGPKIGNGFFSNLNGKFDSLTMDRWLVRTWGRWSGTLLKDMPTQTAEARSRLSTAMKDILNNPEELDRMSQAIGKDITADLHPDELATAIQESSMDPGKRKQMNASPAGEEMRKSGNSLAKYLDGQKEAPAGPTERKFIRQVFGNALDQLRNDPKYKDLTMADLQAVLWYAEKRLYESAKEDLRADDVVEGYADEEAPDYARAAVNVAKAKGIGDRKINNILKQEEQRGRSANARSPNVEEEGTVGGKQGETRGFTGDKERNTFIADQAVKRVRSNLNGTDGPSYAYQARSGGDGGGVRGLKDLGATYVNEWKLGPKASTIFRANNVPAPTFYELDASGGAKKGLSNAQIFANKITESKANNRFGSSVYVYSPEEYANMRLFLTKDGQTGVAVKPDGDIVSVFAPNNSKHLNGIMHLATSVGGNKLDAFDTVLPRLYSTHGFRPVSRTLWDDQFAPEGWDKSTFEKYKNGEPDVVFMAHDPSYMGQHEPGAGKVMTGNNAYTRAFNARDRHLKTIKERIPKMADGGSVAQPIHESFLNPSLKLANGSVTLNPLEFMPNYLRGGKVHVSDNLEMMRHELNRG